MPDDRKKNKCRLGRTEILHLSQLAVGAGSPTASPVVDRLNKPALPHQKFPY